MISVLTFVDLATNCLYFVGGDVQYHSFHFFYRSWETVFDKSVKDNMEKLGVL